MARGSALIRHVGRADSGLQLEHFPGEVGRGAEAAGGERELVRLALEQGDQIAQRFGRNVGMDDEDVVRGCKLDHRRKVAVEPKTHIGE